MYKLNKIGGIIVLVSLFLPIIYISTEIRDISGFVIVWLCGLAFTDFNQPETQGFYFMPDFFFVGPILTIILLYTGIISIKKESAEAKSFGIFSIILTISYYIAFIILFVVFKSILRLNELVILIIPFIGFFGIIIGCSLIVYSNIKS